jgi:hypothetical protein
MTYLVVSGIPGSGKSTLARQLAPRLGRPVLDKDDILDGLFESQGIGDMAWRTTLSRSADQIFAHRAAAVGGGLLVTWWRHPRSESESGTPTDWLSDLSSSVVEVYCVCPPALAAARFMTRKRHAGHLDSTRTLDEIVDDFERLALLGPLACGPVVYAATGSDVRLDDLVAALGA